MSIEQLNSYRIILFSKSPRRFELLKQLGLEFEVHDQGDVTESFPPELKGSAIAKYLAERKSDAYEKPLQEREILITADTIVWHSDHILDKPRDEKEARAMLEELSGDFHRVFTGVCIRSCLKKKVFVSETTVKFSHISEFDINHYIHHYKPFDKAGAYGIQEWIGSIAVERINGSYFNVMGLPVQRVYRELVKFTATGS
ncbi:MAG: septum formation protein Maf [Bacteroidales bacterium]|nr:septum formation protein Maf [Bacteroidales bacterium]MBN2697784.1 septum formation protein Maf [Bacteroidales bacterium]